MENRHFLGDHPIRYPEGFAGLSVSQNWITDAVVAARFCKSGLSGLDYHGKQPVSRNARILIGSSDSPVLRFGFLQSGFVPLEIGSYEAAPWCCCAELTKDGQPAGEFFAMAQGKSVFFQIESSNRPFCLQFDSTALNANVHGKITWKKEPGVFPLLFTGENKYLLRDWVAEEGCFLVPPAKHAKIFGVDLMTDVNNLDMLPPVTEAAKNSDELLFDSRTVLILDTAHLVRVTEENGVFTISFDANHPVCFNFSFGDSVEEAKTESLRIQNTYAQVAREQFKRYQKVAENRPSVIFESVPELGEIAAALPGYVQSATQPIGVTRASASSYYWVWGWDNLVTAHEMSKWGDLDGQRSVIRFFLSHRWRDGSVPHRYGRNYEVLQSMQFGAVDCLLISLIHQHFCDTGDTEFLKECYPTVLELWSGLRKKSDTRGFIRGLGYYPDNTRAMGRTENGVTALESGAFYLTARLISELAAACGDRETAEQAAQTADLIESSYLDCFFDPDIGTLLDARGADGSPNQIFPLYDYLAAHSRRGLTLFLPKIDAISDFVEKNYLTDSGIRTMPEWDPHTHTESIHHSWYLHWDIYALKLMRYGALATGDDQRLIRISNRYSEIVRRMWQRCRAVMELADLDDMDPETGWTKYGQAWNLNCASGLYRALIESLAGIMTDGGTITVLPGGLSAEIESLSACGGCWNFDRTGTGVFSHLVVDGAPVWGSCTVPSEFYTPGNHRVTAIYTMPYHNPLILDFIGGKIFKLKQTQSGITCSTVGTGKLLLLSDAEPSITFNSNCEKARHLHARLWELTLTVPGNLHIGGTL